MNPSYQTITANDLRQFAISVFKSIGCNDVDSELASDVLLKADLRGIDSHGVARLSGYIRLWEKGRINPKPNVKIIRQTASTATIDGDAGLGLVVAPRAMDLAIEKGKNCGTGWVAVGNSNHFGIAAYHAMKALEFDMIGYALTNASPLVAPTFSKERMLGTNPICSGWICKRSRTQRSTSCSLGCYTSILNHRRNQVSLCLYFFDILQYQNNH